MKTVRFTWRYCLYYTKLLFYTVCLLLKDNIFHLYYPLCLLYFVILLYF